MVCGQRSWVAPISRHCCPIWPRWLLPISLALSLTYGYDAVRGWLLHTRTILPIGVEIAMLIVFMFVLIALGTAAFNALERRVRVRGTLGQH